MLRLMTPIDALSYGIKAGMVLGQAQTLWATRLMEMQGFWLGFPPMVPDAPAPAPQADPEDGPAEAAPVAVVTELHVEAMVTAPVAEVAAEPADAPVMAEPVADPAPVAEPVALVSPAPEIAPEPDAAPLVMAEAHSPLVPEAGEKPRRARARKAEAAAVSQTAEPVAAVESAVESPAALPAGLELKPVPRRAARRDKRAANPPSAE